MFIIDEPINITVQRSEANFDKACDEAYMNTLSKLGIDDYGHSDRVIGWERSLCCIELVFKQYIRIDNNGHIYKFSATVKKDND